MSESPLGRAGAWRLTFFDDIGLEQRKSWLVSGLLGAGELTCVYGFPGCGKSVLLGDAACHVASGRPWFGRTVTQGAVLYVAAERPGLVKRRFAAWRRRHGLDGLPLAVLEGSFDLSDPEGGKCIVAAGRQLAQAVECPVVWLIIDTKSRVMGAGDPNADRDMQALIDNLTSVQAALDGPHVTIVDHVPHASPERMKGSGVLAGAVDGSFRVRQDGAVRALIIGSKPPNDGPDELEISFTLESEVIGSDDTGETTAPVVVSTDAAPAASVPIRAPRLKPAAQRVLAAYHRLVDDGRACSPPAVPGVEAGMKAVALADLREKALDLGIFPEPEPPVSDADARKKWRNGRAQAWKRGWEGVQKAGALRLEREFVWDPRRRIPMTER